MIAKNKPVVKPGEPAVTTIAKAQPVTKPAPTVAAAKPAPAVTPAAPPAPTVAQAESRPFQRRALFAPKPANVKIPFTAPAPGTDLDTMFRKAHGTDYDPSSPVDRQKMESLKHAGLETNESGTRTF
jgi:hypothetical protein